MARKITITTSAGKEVSADKVYRTPQQEQYLWDAIETIDTVKKQWPEWKNVAVNLYHALKNSNEYKEAKEWVTIDQVFNDLADFLNKVKEKKWMSDKLAETIGGEIYALFQMLQDDKLELTDEQNKLIKGIILYWFSYHCWDLSNYEVWLEDMSYVWFSIGERNMSINLLNANFKRFSQQDREEIISKIMNIVHTGHKVELSGWKLEESRSDHIWYYPRECRFDVHYSFWTQRHHGTAGISANAIYPLVIETLQNSTNEELIFRMFWYMNGYNKDKIPQNCISEYSDMEKLKKYITPEILEGHRHKTIEAFEILKELWLTITWDVAEQWSEKVIKWYWDDSERGHSRYVDRTGYVNRLSEKIIQKDSVKQALHSIRDLEKFKQYFSSEYIWGLLDDKHKEPKYVNEHINALEPILDEDWLDILLQQFKESTEWKELSDSEKFHRNVFNSLPTKKLGEVWNYIDLTTITEQDFWQAKDNWLYNFIEWKWLLGTPYINQVLEWHWNPKTHSVYFMHKTKWEVWKNFLEGVLNNDKYYNDILSSEEATALMQDVYATQDENLLKKLFDKIWKFSKSCTQEEVNILTRKIIKTISSKEDFQKFYNMMENYAYSEKFGIFLKIKYLLTGKLNKYELEKHKTEIPSDIYASLISSKIINIGKEEELPKVWPSVFVDSDDLMKLSGYYDEMVKDKEKAEAEARQAEQERQERLQREKEENEKIYKEAIENREKWEVVFDKYTKHKIFEGQKYILSVDRKNHILKFATAPIDECGFHSDLHNKYIEEWRCLWWGFLDKDDKSKTIRLWGYSQSYGSVSQEEYRIMLGMLKKEFPDYTIW